MKSSFYQEQILPAFSFIKKPHYTFGKNDKTLTRVVGCITIFILVTIWNNSVTLWDASTFVGADFPQKVIKDQSGWSQLFLTTILLAPLIEELIFRAHLKSVIGSFIFYISIPLWIIISLINKQIPPLNYRILVILFGLVLFITILRLLYSKLKQEHSFRALLIRYFPFHVWLSVLLFGMMHTLNYVYDSSTSFLWSPLLVLPQLFGGIMLAYVRVRFGLVYSILLHVMINGFTFISIYVLR